MQLILTQLTNGTYSNQFEHNLHMVVGQTFPEHRCGINITRQGKPRESTFFFSFNKGYHLSKQLYWSQILIALPCTSTLFMNVSSFLVLSLLSYVQTFFCSLDSSLKQPFDLPGLAVFIFYQMQTNPRREQRCINEWSVGKVGFILILATSWLLLCAECS